MEARDLKPTEGSAKRISQQEEALTWVRSLRWLPLEYEPIKILTEYTKWSIVLCAREEELKNWKTHLVRAASPSLMPQVRSLVAIKVYTRGDGVSKYPNVSREVEMQERIRTQAKNSRFLARFLEVLSVDQNCEQRPRWFATRGVSGHLTLRHMLGLWTAQNRLVPEELIWHIFAQISEALAVLRYECDPPITHCSLEPEIILVEWHQQDSPGFPNLMLTGFGLAVSKPYHAVNMHSLCQLLLQARNQDLVCGAEQKLLSQVSKQNPEGKDGNGIGECTEACEHTKGWFKFLQALVDVAKVDVANATNESLPLLRHNHGHIANENVKQASRAIRDNIQDIILRKVEENERQTENLLESAIRACTWG